MYFEMPSGLRVGGFNSPLIITDYDDSGISYESTDITIPNRAGVYLGRDRQTERTLTFTIRTGGGVRNLTAAQELADLLTSEWVESAYKEPGSLTTLVIETRPDRRRRVMGRCRKITAVNPDVRAMQGSIELLAEFVWSDPVAYAETDTVFGISVLPEQTGGLYAPLVAPLKAATWGGTGYRFVTNEGDTPARMAVRFIGPCSNPKITVDGQEVAIKKTLAYDEVIRVDGRTGIVRNTAGANMSRYLTSRTRLDNLTLTPGRHEVSFTADDQTNTARAELLFASAYRNV